MTSNARMTQPEPQDSTSASDSQCRACGATGCEPLHTQHFVLPGVTDKLSYKVVTCPRCGFVFADGVPSPEALEAHYSAAEHHLHTDVPHGLRLIHRDFFDFIIRHIELSPSTCVLDIGSGMGHFLNIFKSAGYQRVVGLEPTRAARAQAQATYGIEIVTQTLGHYAPEHPFDLVTMCGVLEHIPDLHEALTKMRQLTTEGGHLFLAVPDATQFGAAVAAEPFLEFALEHINFFTRNSLSDLLERHGFHPIRIESRHNTFYDNHYLYALFVAGPASLRPPRYDPEGAASVARYAEDSNRKQMAIRTEIESLAARGEELIVWGAGSLATRLCATTPVERLNVLAFVDKNPQLHDKTILGIPVRSPEWLDRTDRNTPVLVFSTTYGAEIEKLLIERFDWKGKILRIDRIGATT